MGANVGQTRHIYKKRDGLIRLRAWVREYVKRETFIQKRVRQKRHVHTKRDFSYECVSEKQAGREGISGWVWEYVKIDVFIPKETYAYEKRHIDT